MTSDYVPTVGELRQAYVEASGASMAQESYYAEQVAEFERGIARVKAEGAVEALKRLEFECKSVALSIGGNNLNGAVALRETAQSVSAFRARIEKETGL